VKRTANGTTVFIGGSRSVSRLTREVKQRLDNIIAKGLTVLIGDANGADKAVQRHLADQQHARVVVFCMAGECRNNVGNWPTRSVVAPAGARGFAYYSTKDRAMGTEADYGLMLWDGSSRGTLTNVVDLVRQGKPVVVYVAPAKSFTTLRDPRELSEWLRKLDPGILPKVERNLHVATRAATPHPPPDMSLF